MLFLPRFHCDTQSIRILPYLVATLAWEPHVNKRNDVLQHPNKQIMLTIIRHLEPYNIIAMPQMLPAARLFEDRCPRRCCPGDHALFVMFAVPQMYLRPNSVTMLGVPEDAVLATRRSTLLTAASRVLPATRLCHDDTLEYVGFLEA